MISREQVIDLLNKYVKTDWLKLHMRESEVIMRAVARELGEEEDLWGLAGLLHDIDFDYVEKDSKRHGVEFEDIFKQESVNNLIPEEIYHAIRAHNEDNPKIEERRESKLDYALAASENLSGFLVACALVMPDKKISSVKVDSVVKKLNKKEFAKAVRRDLIYDIDKVGLSLERFIEISLDAVSEISDEIGL